MDWALLCGGSPLVLWSKKNQDLGVCFSRLALDLPAAVTLAAVSSYYIGKEYNWVLRGHGQLAVLSVRALICLCLSLIPFVNLVIKSHAQQSLFVVDYVTTFVVTASWLSHAVYVTVLKQRVSRSLRGPLPALFAWILTTTPCIFQLRRVVTNYQLDDVEDSDFWSATSTAICQLLYLLTLIPHGMASVTTFDTTFRSLADVNVTQNLMSFNRFSIDTDPFYLGTARDGITFLSRVFLSWVRPLMVKGDKKENLSVHALQIQF